MEMLYAQESREEFENEVPDHDERPQHCNDGSAAARFSRKPFLPAPNARRRRPGAN